MMSRVKRTVAARLLELSVMIIVGAAAAVGRKTGSKTDDRRFAAVVTSATFVLPFIGEWARDRRYNKSLSTRTSPRAFVGGRKHAPGNGKASRCSPLNPRLTAACFNLASSCRGRALVVNPDRPGHAPGDFSHPASHQHPRNAAHPTDRAERAFAALFLLLGLARPRQPPRLATRS